MLVRQSMCAAMIVRNLVIALHIQHIKWLCYCDLNDCSIQSVDGAKDIQSQIRFLYFHVLSEN